MIVNLFAHRHTDPNTLRQTADPVGPANGDALRMLTSIAPRTVAAWGAAGRLHGRSRTVTPLLDRPLCLGPTNRGEPRHPLYVPRDTPFVTWTIPLPREPWRDRYRERQRGIIAGTTSTSEASANDVR